MIKIEEEELRRIPLVLGEMGYRVIVPSKVGGITKLVRASPESTIDLDYVRVINSPRDFLLPDGEELYRYRSSATVTTNGLRVRFPSVEGPCPVTIDAEWSEPEGKFAFFAIHPCMANSIKYLDKVMLSDPPDPYYSKRRRGALIAVLECAEGDDKCFCVPAGSWKVPEEYCDISMRRVVGGYALRGLSKIGREILGKLDGSRCEYSSEPPRIRSCFSISASESEIDSSSNQDLEMCTLCASCTVTCPTCYCSDIEDRFSLVDPSDVARVRKRMSCQRRCYGMIAGGNIFLRTKEERYRWRIKHKFPYSERVFGIHGCVGCGNCIAFCPSGIDIRKTISRVPA
ncbi:MAG: 4Fe-4S dicluster domain-containing protein [Candidatus Verstraetearchaeota archaeon]|nr:4Fe-4S dicluster domain-containing protein [Candidatus Verstraetearchaeota archaeon]